MSETKASVRPSKITGSILRTFIERVERLREEKKSLSDDEKQVFAEAVANGFDAKTIRRCIKLRATKPNDREEQEALLDTYLHAIGMAKETPLFTAVGKMAVDIAAREQVIEAFMHFVPQAGEVVVRMGGAAIRLWRDEDGDPHAEDYIEAERRKAAKDTAADPISGKGEPFTYKPRHAPRLPSLASIKEIADRAEAAAAAKRPAGETGPAK